MAIPTYTIDQLANVRRMSDIVYVMDAALPIMFWINAGTSRFLAINAQKFYDLVEGAVSREAVLDVKAQDDAPDNPEEGDIWTDKDGDETSIWIE